MPYMGSVVVAVLCTALRPRSIRDGSLHPLKWKASWVCGSMRLCRRDGGDGFRDTDLDRTRLECYVPEWLLRLPPMPPGESPTSSRHESISSLFAIIPVPGGRRLSRSTSSAAEATNSPRTASRTTSSPHVGRAETGHTAGNSSSGSRATSLHHLTTLAGASSTAAYSNGPRDCCRTSALLVSVMAASNLLGAEQSDTLQEGPAQSAATSNVTRATGHLPLTLNGPLSSGKC